MKAVFISLTGQTRKFVQKLGWESLEITPVNPFIRLEEPFVIITPTYEKEATEILEDFIETGDNRRFLMGIAGGGNRNFGELFVFTAKDLAEKYQVPLLLEFEFQGTEKDTEKLKRAVSEYAKA